MLSTNWVILDLDGRLSIFQFCGIAQKSVMLPVQLQPTVPRSCLAPPAHGPDPCTIPVDAAEPPEAPPEAAEDLRDEVLQFNTNCPECNAPAATNMKLVQIPHFKEVIIMATTCDSCGHRTNEVKSGGAIEAQGTRITLRITDASDMTRDVLKSETCSVEIPELDFELGMGALGGKFTTLEGLLRDIKELVERNPFELGDSGAPGRGEKLRAFGARLLDIIEGRMEAHFIMDDPAGNSYLQGSS
ncbi:zinc finger protein ZPR1 [Nothoprocta perdicaria]|uniref:zinc finger protein ZPR1 n=1 Tax=Nothoprocta perdicaria TaxID=30464 RepID=UPI000E1C0DEF|nr:zinc finger protein ZPR1 [Nothoprocta perdicaria]